MSAERPTPDARWVCVIKNGAVCSAHHARPNHHRCGWYVPVQPVRGDGPGIEELTDPADAPTIVAHHVWQPFMEAVRAADESEIGTTRYKARIHREAIAVVNSVQAGEGRRELFALLAAAPPATSPEPDGDEFFDTDTPWHSPTEDAWGVCRCGQPLPPVSLWHNPDEQWTHTVCAECLWTFVVEDEGIIGYPDDTTIDHTDCHVGVRPPATSGETWVCRATADGTCTASDEFPSSYHAACGPATSPEPDEPEAAS